jgi:hypothetical protein
MICFAKKLHSFYAGLVFCVVLAFATPALADFDLRITEIWPGNEPGDNLTEDWFEVTNFGDMAWTAAVDGDLYYDDDSRDAGTADLMSNVDSIGPGESAVFVNGGASGASEWFIVWNPVASVPLLGYFDGSGLGGGGDEVSLFLDDDFDGPQADELFTFADYPDADSNGGQSYDTRLGEFSVVGNANGAVATIVLNDVDQAAIGSPGQAPIPEPTSVVLVLLGGMLAACRARHR